MKNYSMISYQKQHLDQLNLYHTFYFLDRIDDDEINLRVHVNEENEKYSARYLVPVESYRKLVEFLENVDLEKEAVHGKGQTDKGNTDLNKEWLDFEMEDGKTYQVTEMNEYLRQIPDMMKEIERISGEPLYRNPRQAPSSKESQPQPAATAPESQDFWICPTCGKKLTRQFCFSCGTSRSNTKPSIVSTSMDDASWICPNCGNECHGNFCMACGNRKVVQPSVVEPEPVPMVEDAQENEDVWLCPSCGRECHENFCFVCGVPRSAVQPVEITQPNVVQEPVVDDEPVETEIVDEPDELAEIEPWICPVCGTTSNYIFCICCGALNPEMDKDEPSLEPEEEALPNGMWKCPYCGTVNEDAVCVGCGWEKEEISNAEETRAAIDEMLEDDPVSISETPETTEQEDLLNTEDTDDAVSAIETSQESFGFALAKPEEASIPVSIAPMVEQEEQEEQDDGPEIDEDMWICPNCGNENSGLFCVRCGNRMPMEGFGARIQNTDSMLWYCPNCGAENRKRFCGDCGTEKPD